MSNRDSFNTSCGNANQTKVATGLSNAVSEQTTIDAKLTVVGYTTQNGNFANLDSATRTANELRFLNALAREKARQSSVAAARDTLRTAGDLAPF
jgi:hypothetical protein